jgi:hypothetical protein
MVKYHRKSAGLFAVNFVIFYRVVLLSLLLSKKHIFSLQMVHVYLDRQTCDFYFNLD